MRKNGILILTIAFLLAFNFNTFSQNIEAVANAPWLTTSGSISISQIATHAPDNPNVNPYALFLGGNLNFNAFGVINVPLSFAYTNQQLTGNISLPFNRFSISPSYRWITVHAGFTSMQFSPYSLAGHEVFGGGIELMPDNGFRIRAIYGRMRRANDAETDPSFRRMGGGFSVEYTADRFDIGVNIFKAQDIIFSNPFSNPDSIPINPQDNLTGSVNFGFRLIQNLRISGEYGISALNRNIGLDEESANRFALLHTENGDLAVFHAGRVQLAYTFGLSTVGTTYERIAPNYTTLGAHYMTNDFENITANFSTVIGRTNIVLDGGFQRNNLDNQRATTNRRIIYSANVSSNVNERLNLNVSFSNLQAFVFINDVYSQVTQTTPFENLDTLNVTMLNYNASLNASYLLQNTETRRQSMNFNFMYQRSAEAQQFSRFSGNNIFNTTLAYQISFIPAQLNISASVTNSYNQMPDDMFINAMTYNLSLQRTFFDVLRSSLSATFSDMRNQDGRLSNVLNTRLSTGYTLAQRHNFNLAMTLLHTGGIQTRTQYMANLTYSYTFNAILNREDEKLRLRGNF